MGLFCCRRLMPSFRVANLVSPFWLVFWSAGLSWCWLLPNHYPPWSAFHMDAWSATMYLPLAAAVLWLTRADTRLSGPALLILVLLAVPWLQFAFGLIPSPGTAWISFSYLLGFGLAMIVGQRWEFASPAQVGDGLFLAIGIAAFASVGLQLHQWLQLNLIHLWSMGNGYGRPFANFGQPNQLGTLLLWSLLALGWGAWRVKIRPTVAVLAMVFVLFGLALTGSRTAWIGLLGLTAGVWYWRRLWPWSATPRVVMGLLACFVCFVWIVPVLTDALLLGSAEGEIEALTRVSSELRPQIWAILVDAALQQPWSGYGWNQVATAHLAGAPGYPALKFVFAHAHNLFLDLVLWNGIPLGLILSALVIGWFCTRFLAVREAGSAMLLLLVAVAANHAMLELPLHYAYFLLPVGLVAGALESRLGWRLVNFGQRWLGAALWFTSAAMLALLVRDYMRVEASYQVLRFEWANIQTNASREPPDVILLDQLRDVIALSRFEPTQDISAEDLMRLRHTAALYPSAAVIHKLAVALVWKQQAEEAVVWLRRLCAVVPATSCQAVKTSWENLAKTDPLVGKVPWPN